MTFTLPHLVYFFWRFKNGDALYWKIVGLVSIPHNNVGDPCFVKVPPFDPTTVYVHHAVVFKFGAM
jgi:hypothetical protein